MSPLCLPYVSPISPLYLPYVSPTSPLHLPYISPISPVQLDGPTKVSLRGSFRQPKGNSPALDKSTSNVTAPLTGSFGANATFPRWR